MEHPSSNNLEKLEENELLRIQLRTLVVLIRNSRRVVRHGAEPKDNLGLRRYHMTQRQYYCLRVVALTNIHTKQILKAKQKW